MSQISVKQIKKELAEMNYLATLHQTPKGVILTLPRGGFDYPGIDHESNYKLEFKGKKSLIYWNDEEYLVGPEYSIRLLTLYDIYSECSKINYDTEYIQSYDIAGEELPDDFNLLDILPSLKSKRQQNLERDLLELHIEAELNDFPEGYDEIAENLKVGEGYRLIKNLYGIEPKKENDE